MSVSTPVVPSNPLPPTQIEVPKQGETPKPCNPNKYVHSNHKASDAALRFLLDRDPKGWDQLIGLCYVACRGLYFPDAWAPYTSDGSKMLGQEERVRDFIVGWLGDELEECKKWLTGDIRTVEPKLRHIPRRCRLAIIAQIRKCPSCGQRKTKECLDCGYILSHRDVNKGAKACPKCCSSSLHMVCRHKCATPSVRISLDTPFSDGDDTNQSKLSDYVTAPDDTPDLSVWLEETRPSLDGIHPKLHAYLTLVLAHFEDSGYKRYVTTHFAAQEEIPLKAARKLKKEIQKALLTELHRPIIRELALLLEHCQDVRVPELAVPMSKRAKEAGNAKREATRLVRESFKELGIPELSDPPADAGWDDPESPVAGRDARCSSATSFVLADGGMREIAAQESLEAEIRDVADEDDVRAYFGLRKNEPIPLEIDTECVHEEDITYDDDTGYDLDISD